MPSCAERAQGTPAGRFARLLAARPVRYALAAIGPIGSSATQFVLSLVMLRLLAPGAFGTFTFLLVASQLSWGMWSALFCAPLPVFLARGEPAEQAAGEATLLASNLTGAALTLPLFALMAVALGLHPAAVACFAGYGALALLRWFGRAYAYVHERPLRTMSSDIVYSVSVLVGLAAGVLFLGWEPQTACYAALLIGAAAGLLPFGASYFRIQFARLDLVALRRYGLIWRRHARWALLGIVTTEATANAHVYLITLLNGPTAFAPIAASALLMRPVNVAQNALADFERPQMARLIGERRTADLARSVRVFRLALGTGWIATALVAAALFLTAPRLLFPKAYDLHFLAVATALWVVFAALRLIQTPDSTMLQAAGEFRPLAMASVWSSIATVGSMLLLILSAGILWSLVGLIAGAAMFLFWTHRYAHRWRQRSDRISGDP